VDSVVAKQKERTLVFGIVGLPSDEERLHGGIEIVAQRGNSREIVVEPIILARVDNERVVGILMAVKVARVLSFEESDACVDSTIARRN